MSHVWQVANASAATVAAGSYATSLVQRLQSELQCKLWRMALLCTCHKWPRWRLLGLVADLEKGCQLPDDVVLIKRLAQLLHVARPAAQAKQQQQQQQQQQMLMKTPCSSRAGAAASRGQTCTSSSSSRSGRADDAVVPIQGCKQLLHMARPAAAAAAAAL
jgi:hypothetical protein